MTSGVDVPLGDAGRLDLSHEAQSLQRVTLLGVVLKGTSPAAMEGSMVWDVSSCEVKVDVLFKGCYAKAALLEAILAS